MSQLDPSQMSTPNGVLAAYSAAMKVVHALGVQADAEHTHADRVIWIPGTIRSDDRTPWQPDDGEALSFHGTRFEVSIYAASFEALWARVHDLHAWTNVILGPKVGSPDQGPGYEIGDSTPQPRGEATGGGGWGVVVPITIKGPVYRRHFPAVQAQRATLAVQTTGRAPGPGDPETAAQGATS